MNTLSDRFIPKNQAEADWANASLEADAANRVLMNTVVWAPEYPAAKARMQEAREKLVAAVKAARPSWIVF